MPMKTFTRTQKYDKWNHKVYYDCSNCLQIFTGDYEFCPHCGVPFDIFKVEESEPEKKKKGRKKNEDKSS